MDPRLSEYDEGSRPEAKLRCSSARVRIAARCCHVRGVWLKTSSVSLAYASRRDALPRRGRGWPRQIRLPPHDAPAHQYTNRAPHLCMQSIPNRQPSDSKRRFRGAAAHSRRESTRGLAFAPRRARFAPCSMLWSRHAVSSLDTSSREAFHQAYMNPSLVKRAPGMRSFIPVRTSRV